MTRGEDRRIDVERLLPCRQFARGAFEDEDAEFDDDARLLGDRDEDVRAEAAEARMIPAQQRLEAGDGAILQPHDRLEIDLDLAARERAAQIGLERQPVGALRAHARPEHLDAIAAAVLGVAHGDLGVLEHVVALGVQLRIEQGDADRGRQADLALGEGDRRRQRAAHGLGELHDMFGIGFGNDDDRERVAGNAGQRVLRLQQARQPARGRQQDRIAGGHADALVDLLEPVEIDAQNGRPPVVAAREGERGLQPVEEQFAVGQAGQIVVHGVVQQALLRRALVGDVDQRADDADHLAVGADHRAAAQAIPEIVAIAGAQPELLVDAAAALFEQRVEAGAIAVALERMQDFEPAGRRAFEFAAIEARDASRPRG